LCSYTNYLCTRQ